MGTQGENSSCFKGQMRHTDAIEDGDNLGGKLRLLPRAAAIVAELNEELRQEEEADGEEDQANNLG